ncbi:MAG: flagellar protein FlgN [Candidatus Zixiibacteriota bacterium]
MIDQLISIVGKEATLFESFLALLERQQQALVENDADCIKSVSESLHEKLVQAQLLNTRREELVDSIRSAHGLSEDVTVTRLLDLLDQDHAARLSGLRDLILTLSEKINHVRNQNAVLLNRSREYIQKTMEMLSQLSSPMSGYSQSGQETRTSHSVAVDRSA